MKNYLTEGVVDCCVRNTLRQAQGDIAEHEGENAGGGVGEDLYIVFKKERFMYTYVIAERSDYGSAAESSCYRGNRRSTRKN